jgi:hypothetical protein
MIPRLALMAVIAFAQVVSPEPPVPYEDWGACPFEGCVYREWTARLAVRVHRDRFERSPVAFSVRRGEKVTALTGVVVTTTPGEVQFRRAVDLATPGATVHVEPGETLYLLTYRGEGHTVAWFKGQIYDPLDGSVAFFNASCADAPGTCAGDIVVEPKRVWWVQLKNSRGQIGWSAEPDTFDGRDALGH